MDNKDQLKDKQEKPGMSSAKKAVICAAVVLVLIAAAMFIRGQSGDDMKSYAGAARTMIGSFDSDDYEFGASSDDYQAGYTEIQGSWYLYGITADGESMLAEEDELEGYLHITGRTWTMDIVAGDETMEESGIFEVIDSAETDDGTAYLYAFYSEETEDYIQAVFMPDRPAMCISMTQDFDPDNMYVFDR